jgi:hypothetical protein
MQTYNFVCFGTQSFTLRVVYELCMFENRTLRRIFGPEREGVSGGWGTLFIQGAAS